MVISFVYNTKYHMWNNVKYAQLSNFVHSISVNFISLHNYQLTGAFNERLIIVNKRKLIICKRYY